MIPCHVCGKDIGGGWSIGFPPAPDSQKMGLCREHDRAAGREEVTAAWRELIYSNLEENNRNSAHRAGDIPQLLSIYFTGGGAISIPCSSFSLVEGKTLRVLTPGGENIYFPLGQVRNYALSPLMRQEPPRQAHEMRRPLPTEEKAVPEEAPEKNQAADDAEQPENPEQQPDKLPEPEQPKKPGQPEQSVKLAESEQSKKPAQPE